MPTVAEFSIKTPASTEEIDSKKVVKFLQQPLLKSNRIMEPGQADLRPSVPRAVDFPTCTSRDRLQGKSQGRRKNPAGGYLWLDAERRLPDPAGFLERAADRSDNPSILLVILFDKLGKAVLLERPVGKK